MGLNLLVPCDWYLTEHVFWTEWRRGGHSSTRRSKSQTRLLAYDLCSYRILMGLIAVSRTPQEAVLSHFPYGPMLVLSAGLRRAGNTGAGVRACTQVQDAETGEIRPTCRTPL